MKRINIAIDGPAGAGKSTVAKAVAQKLSILYLDTGAMYRALALKAIRAGIDPNDAKRVVPMLDETVVAVENVDGTQHTLLDGEDVSGLIRTPEISKGASDISAIPQVRIKLVEYQRGIARDNDVVMEGRDMGSYVIPETKNKFYITASSYERANRRLRELNAKGIAQDKSLEEIQRDIEQRDYNDSHREFAPLKRMPDAVFIDTTDLTIEQAVNMVIEKIEV